MVGDVNLFLMNESSGEDECAGCTRTAEVEVMIAGQSFHLSWVCSISWHISNEHGDMHVIM